MAFSAKVMLAHKKEVHARFDETVTFSSNASKMSRRKKKQNPQRTLAEVEEDEAEDEVGYRRQSTEAQFGTIGDSRPGLYPGGQHLESSIWPRFGWF